MGIEISKMCTKTKEMPSTDVSSIVSHLQKSKRIVALLGAGLSASSGLPTFRGAGGFWRTRDATMLATPQAFRADPGLVWQFYSYRRHMALNATPNRAHLALAELARRNPNFITLSQNVDGLSPRAKHPAEQLKLLHGNLFDLKCWDQHRCGYFSPNDFTDPIVPALAIPEDQEAAKASIGRAKKEPVDSAMLEAHIAKKGGIIKGDGEDSSEMIVPTKKGPKVTGDAEVVLETPRHALIKGADISNISVPVPTIEKEDLPQCPKCKKNLLRPGVVWFGESLPEKVMQSVENYFGEPEKIDLMLVIGTSSKVYPAAGYTELARQRGARVAVINMNPSDAKSLGSQDWLFEGDAAEIVPDILKSVIGETKEFEP